MEAPEASLVEGLHHVAVVVEDVPAAVAFYQQVFALPRIERLTARLSNHGGAWFRLGSQELHLQERKGAGPKTDQHLAMLTRNFDEILARVPAAGGRVEEAKLIEGMRKRCFVYDLDGNRIELLER